MARQYLVDGIAAPITGDQLIDLSVQLFCKKGTHSCGDCAKPRTVVKAAWFLKNVLHINVKTKLESETEWKEARS